ncbi:SPFH domain-containing protein [soil metagenome]
MGLMRRLRGELIDIIEWTDSSTDTIVYRFERYGNEIKNGARLVVREGQTAVFVDEGKLADVFSPGTYMLETANLPVLSTLRGWKYGFQSPFKAEVYFVNTRRFTDLKWGTLNPIMMRDAEFGPVRMRAFGTYAMRIEDAATFLREVGGTSGHVTTDDITNQIRNTIVSRFADVLAGSGFAVLDMAANQEDLSNYLKERIAPDIAGYGVELVQLLVENVSLPPAVEEALDKRSSMGVIGNLGAYTQYQAAQAMEAAAKNPEGTASGGMGMGMGFAMAQQMAQQFGGQQQAPQQQGPQQGAPPPPPPAAAAFHIASDGQTQGPFSMDQLREKVSSGNLTRETQVWRDGMDGWSRAADVDELRSLFPATPPPLPPAA